MNALAAVVLMTFPVAMAFAAANDLFTMRIPNKISLALIAAFVVAALLTEMPLSTFGVHVGLALCILAITFVLFSLNLLGGGDAKLMAAGALWLDGTEHAIQYVANITIWGGVLAVIILGYRNFVPATNGFPSWAQRLHRTGGPIPYGIAIAAAGLVVFPATELFRTLLV